MINKAIIVGRLGRDPEVRYTNSGSAVANFSVATDRVWNDRNGQRQSETEWHRVVAFARLGEICGEYLKKGKLVYIEGRIQTREWDDKDGNKRYTTEIVANEMKMLDSGPSSGRSPKEPGQGKEANMDNMEVGITDDDIPF